MSLEEKDLVVVDVLDILYIDNDGDTVFEGNMKKSGIKQKTDKIDIFAGIGNNKITSIKTKKEISVDGTIATFNAKYFAKINGVALDTTSKARFYFRKSVPVTDVSATITGATKIYSIEDESGKGYKIVKTEPTKGNEAQVEGSKITLNTGSTVKNLLVTYEAPQENGKEALTIVLSGKSFPKGGKLLFKTPVYDVATDEECGELQGIFHKVSLDSDWDLSFDLGKPIELPVKMEVLLASTIDGKDNRAEKELGRIVIADK